VCGGGVQRAGRLLEALRGAGQRVTHQQLGVRAFGRILARGEQARHVGDADERSVTMTVLELDRVDERPRREQQRRHRLVGRDPVEPGQRVVVALVEVPPQPRAVDELPEPGQVVALGRRREGDVEVGVDLAQPHDRGELLGAVELRGRRRDDVAQVLEITRADVLELAAGGQAPPAERPHDLEQPPPPSLVAGHGDRDQERSAHERRQPVGDPLEGDRRTASDRDRVLLAERAGEHGEPLEEPLFGLSEQVAAPVDGRLQRGVSRVDLPRVLQVRDADGEPLGQQSRREQVEGRRGQLDGERQPVETSQHRVDGHTVRGGHLEARHGRTRAVEEELERRPVLDRQRRERYDRLPRDDEGFLRGRQHPQPGAAGQQLGDERSDGGDLVLAVVEEHDRRSVPDPLGEESQSDLAVLVRHLEGQGERPRDRPRIRDRREIDVPHPARGVR
jgi:hypothetical protein